MKKYFIIALLFSVNNILFSQVLDTLYFRCSASCSPIPPTCGLTLDVMQINEDCPNSADGELLISVGGGRSPYGYDWSNGATGNMIDLLAAGTYSLTISDADNCSDIYQFTIQTVRTACCTVGGACNDNEDCTINDVLDSNCECAGTAVDCNTTGQTIRQACNDNDNCTINDSLTLLICDNTVCVPCAGIDAGLVGTACNDNDDCTINDIYDSNCDCEGASVDCNSAGQTSVQSCDDNDACTINDQQTILTCDGSICVPCAGTPVDCNTAGQTVSVACDDNDACTDNDVEVRLLCDNSVCIPCSGIANNLAGTACDDGKICTIGETYDVNCNCVGGIFVSNCDDGNAETYNDTFDIDCNCLGIPCPTPLELSAIHPMCSGQLGSITIPNGYTSSDNINNLSAGTYTINYTNSSTACTYTRDISIVEPSTLVVGCAPEIISVGGGTPPYTYLWDDASTTNNIPIANGTVTVTDGNGCTASIFCDFQEDCTTLSLNINPSDVLCFGESTGNLDATVTQQYLPLLHQWSNGFTQQDQFNVAPGDYSLTITDAAGCQVVESATVNEPDPLFARCGTFNSTTLVGLGTLGGGTGGYSFDWTDALGNTNTGQFITYVGDGNYFVTMTDANGCTLEKTCNVGCPSNPSANNSTTFLPCSDPTNPGAILVQDLGTTGGTTPYTFIWSDGEIVTANTFPNHYVPCGETHQLVIEDANGCFSSVSVYNNTTCNCADPCDNFSLACTENGTNVTATVSNGNGFNQFVWSNGHTSSGSNSSTQLIPFNTTTLSVTVTDFENCTAECSISLTGSCVGSICNTDPCTSSGTWNIDCTVCQGQTNIDSDGDGINDCDDCAPNDTNLPSTGACDDLDPNTFDDTYNECLCEGTPCPTITLTENLSPETCNGDGDGTASITPSGGQIPYTYLWSNGATTQSINNLIAGSYSVTVTDDNGCTDFTSVVVIATNNPAICEPCTATNLAIASNVIISSCNNQNTGSIAITVTGGQVPYTYLWSNAATTATVNNIQGIYSVTVTDNQGCQVTDTYLVPELSTINILATNQTNPSCDGETDGNIILDISGSQGILSDGNYTYAWSNGESTKDLTNLSAGTYTITVTENGYNCTKSQTFIINDPGIVCCDTFSLAVFGAGCASGPNTSSVDIDPTGGTAPYTFLWQDGLTDEDRGHSGGEYSVTITDANGCKDTFDFDFACCYPVSVFRECDNAPVENAIVKLNGTVLGFTDAAGQFTIDTCLSATDKVSISSYNDAQNGVDGNDLQAVRNHILGNTLISDVSELIAADVNNNGSISAFDLLLMRSGNIAPSWRFLVNSNYPTVFPSTLDEEATVNESFDFRGIKLGDVSCNARTNICECTTSIVVNSTVQDDINGNSTGSINISVSPADTYFFSWYNTQDGSYTNSEDLIGIGEGTYRLTVSNGCGCIYEETFFVGGATCTPISLTGDFSGSCSETNIALDITVIGGQTPYTYLWSSGETTQDIDTIIAGNDYTLTVTDANGCTGVENFEFSETCECNPMSVFYDITPGCILKIVDGATVVVDNGAIDVSVSGGFPPYTYSWTGFDNRNNININESTEDINIANFFTQYFLAITDNKGCVFLDTILIPDGGLLVGIDKSGILCKGDETGSIQLSVTSETDYTVLWEGGQTSPSLNNLAAGSYAYTVTNEHNCISTFIVGIDEPNQAIFILQTLNHPSCGIVGSIDIDAGGGTSPYTYLWTTGETTEDITNLSGGTYSVTVSDANGCQAIENYTLNGAFSVSCGTTNIIVSGGQIPYTYLWDNGNTNNNIQSGYHTVTVTDNSGCQQVLNCGDCPIAVGTTCDDGDNCTENDVIQENCQCQGTSIASTEGQLCDDLDINTYYDKISCNASCVCTCTGTPCDLSVDLQPIRDCENSIAAIQVFITGNSFGPYQYLWSNGGTNSFISNLPLTGAYTVTVTDAVGCQVIENIALNMDCTPEAFCELNLNSAGGSEGYYQSFTAANDGLASVNWFPYSLPDRLFIKKNGVIIYDECASDIGWNTNYCTATPTYNNLAVPLQEISWNAGDFIEIEVEPNCGATCNSGGLTKWVAAINCIDYSGQLALDIGVSCENLNFHHPITPLATGGTPPYVFEWLSGPDEGKVFIYDPNSPIDYGHDGQGNHNVPFQFGGCDCSDRTLRVTDSNGISIEKTLTVADMPCCNDGDWKNAGWCD